MNNILDNLFYKEKLGIGNKTTFIKNVRERHQEIKVKDIQEYLKNQEVNQINTTVNKTYQYKITAPPRTFQIDIFWWKRGETLIPILLIPILIYFGQRSIRNTNTYIIICRYIES